MCSLRSVLAADSTDPRVVTFGVSLCRNQWRQVGQDMYNNMDHLLKMIFVHEITVGTWLCKGHFDLFVPQNKNSERARRLAPPFVSERYTTPPHKSAHPLPPLSAKTPALRVDSTYTSPAPDGRFDFAFDRLGSQQSTLSSPSESRLDDGNKFLLSRRLLYDISFADRVQSDLALASRENAQLKEERDALEKKCSDLEATVTQLKQQIRLRRIEEDKLRRDSAIVAGQLQTNNDHYRQKFTEIATRYEKRFSTPELRREALKTIADMERSDFYNSVVAHLGNSSRLTKQPLLEYTPGEYLRALNVPAIVDFLRTLVHKADGKSNDALIAQSIATLFKARHSKYVAEPGSVASILTYSLTHSRGAVEILNKVAAGPSFTKIRSLLRSLSVEVRKSREPITTDLLIQFDNEQVLKKSYREIGFNKMIAIVITTVLAHISLSSRVQFEVDVARQPLSTLRRVETLTTLTTLTPEMEARINEFRYDMVSVHLREVLEERRVQLLEERAAQAHQPFAQRPVVIDNVDKEALERERESQGLTCPRCRTLYEKPGRRVYCGNTTEPYRCRSSKVRLLPPSTIPRVRSLNPPIPHSLPGPEQSAIEVEDDTHSEEESDVSSIDSDNDAQPTQRLPPSTRIELLDPCPENPNSYESISRILQHCKVSGEVLGACIDESGSVSTPGDSTGARKSVFIGVDGAPYHILMNLVFDAMRKQEERTLQPGEDSLEWCLPIIGYLHVELNMRRALYSMFWSFSIEKFAEGLGYTSPAAKQYFKNVGDLHKAQDALSIFHSALVKEFVFHYTTHAQSLKTSPTANGFFIWAALESHGPSFRLLYQQVFIFQIAIIAFHRAVRTNDQLLRLAAWRLFSPLWYLRPHPIYQKVDVDDEIQWLTYDPRIKRVRELLELCSRSGFPHKHQGFDAILEEYNKMLKRWVGSNPTESDWVFAVTMLSFREQLQKNFRRVQGEKEVEPRLRTDIGRDVDKETAMRVTVRQSGIFAPGRKTTVGGQSISSALVIDSDLTQEGIRRKKLFVSQRYFVARDGATISETGTIPQRRTNFTTMPVPISEEEEREMGKEERMSREQLKYEIEKMQQIVPEDQCTSDANWKKWKKAPLIAEYKRLKEYIVMSQEGSVSLMNAAAIPLTNEPTEDE